MLDGRGHLLGRLAAIVAKQVLLGKCALPAAPPDSSADQRSVMSNNHHLSFESHDHEINPMHRSETCCLLPPWSWGLWDQQLLSVGLMFKHGSSSAHCCSVPWRCSPLGSLP